MTLFGPGRVLKREGDIWEYQCVCLEFLPNQFNCLVGRRVRLAANWELFDCYRVCVLTGVVTLTLKNASRTDTTVPGDSLRQRIDGPT